MRNIVSRMVEVQLAKDACKMKSSNNDFEFLENIQPPTIINAMVDERLSVEEFDSPLYDRINAIMERAYEE
jgi:hypothetical protein